MVVNFNKSIFSLILYQELIFHPFRYSIEKDNRIPSIEEKNFGMQCSLDAMHLGNVIGLHFYGTFTIWGDGFERNVEKGIKFLERSADYGNGISMKQLFDVYENKEDSFPDYQNPLSAYKYGKGAIMCGINVFKRVINLFNKNYKVLHQNFV